MAKGNIAKQSLMNKFITCAGKSYLGTDDNKKFYFMSEEDGEQIQICVTMTVPKVLFGAAKQVDDESDDQPETIKPSISAQDQAKIDDLMARLGLA